MFGGTFFCHKKTSCDSTANSGSFLTHSCMANKHSSASSQPRKVLPWELPKAFLAGWLSDCLSLLITEFVQRLSLVRATKAKKPHMQAGRNKRRIRRDGRFESPAELETTNSLQGDATLMVCRQIKARIQ